MRSFNIFFVISLQKVLNKQSSCLETPCAHAIEIRFAYEGNFLTTHWDRNKKVVILLMTFSNTRAFEWLCILTKISLKFVLMGRPTDLVSIVSNNGLLSSRRQVIILTDDYKVPIYIHRQAPMSYSGLSSTWKRWAWIRDHIPLKLNMMTSCHGNIFRVTGPFWGESIGDRWIPLQRASHAEL